MSAWWQHPAQPVDRGRLAQALAREAQLTKPAGSLGRLEQIAATLASLQRRAAPRLERIWISIFAADHGIATEGVSAFPQEVTGQMLANFARGGAAISVLARHLNAPLELVDLGLAHAVAPLPGVRHLGIAAGTESFLHGAAMTAAQCDAALSAGQEAVQRAVEDGAELFIGGEMGIGNTSSACALSALLLDQPVSELVGLGTGLTALGLRHKTRVIERVVAHHRPHANDALETLRRVGGLEVAALAGAYIAAAQKGLPVLVDGYISTAAALCAVRMNADVHSWLFYSHRGAEPGHRLLLQALDAEPLLALDLRLGEASGAALAVPLLQAACRLHNEMATFAEAAVSGSFK
ncbi:nicotinate-nucleotide--dimethylbenzimidazole phosphoribosyltransferase [Halopseudomonas aestusnigri]|uniref:Nicotinate-nucleotide--dimethylbenzimidazole phosphoribosyltransferase n=1 Tax=Halopseudomonas aestusnigri TaxID=857252 RepID=A0AAQ1G6C0_9GAMM|nr:nicotinate-nucleotide--dimethylbenzimidazole phosphoribosyltransferase [Halopseudomonas aestusnigri]OWL90181.1 nicotinate-nucleotide--dimethylbenzimidazole phosphoribosyltransferase [Halopseudomonas aestusnigri]SEF85454.1 nicotinate-nucleotide-dimethylbenzimidazole phosphoribosyltransferase [Halopseudomonas aestusnigri]